MMFTRKYGRFLTVVPIVVFAVGGPSTWGQDYDGNGIPDPDEIPAAPAINATPTVTPTPAVTPGPAGYALYFDGGDYVYLGTDSRLNPQGQYTIEAWVKPATTEAAVAVFTRFNHSSHSYSLGLGDWGGIGGPDEGTYLFRCGFPPVGVAALNPPEINVWTHLAGVQDAGTVRLYRNGVFQRELSGAENDQFDVATLIGADYTWGILWHQWQGWIDEVRFWSTARSSDDINHWMNYSIEGSPPGLIGYWDFDDGTGQTALDRGTNGLHGTLGASLDPGDDDPTWVVSDAPILSRPVLPTSTPQPTPTITNTPWDHPPQDCDGNGIADPVQIAVSPELDCNGNGILDVCETGGYAWPAMGQDICERAWWICPGEVYYGSTVNSHNEGGISSSCLNNDLSPDIWYVYVPDSNGPLTVSFCASSYGYDVIAAIFDGCPNAVGVELICDYGSPWGQIVDFPVEAGRTYYIRVTGRTGFPHTPTGNFRIHLTGPGCLTTDCNKNGTPDDCEEAGCGAGVLCYDDGDGSADTAVNESLPASFLVKFSVPSTFTGLRQVAKITWYPGSGTIESPKALVRSDLAGGFGTSQNCIVEDITEVTPNAFNEVSLGQNPKEFLVQGGDVFYAGVYGRKLSLGADAPGSTVVMTTMGGTYDQTGDPCDRLVVPWPTVAPTHSIPCWAKRNYKLNQAGIHYPTDQLLITPMGDSVCHKSCTDWTTTHLTCTNGSCWTTTELHWACDVTVSRDFRIEGHNWLIRARLAGTSSPELLPGCYDRTIPVGTSTSTPTQTHTPTPTPTSTSTATFMPIPVYGDPAPVVELNSSGRDYAPYLTGDLLEVYFISDRSGNDDIWCATRESVDAAWNQPFNVAELNSGDVEWNPVLSADGLEIFFGSKRGLDWRHNWNRVYRSTRADRLSPWLPAVEVRELGPPQSQDNFSQPSYLSEDGLRLYTHRRFGDEYSIYVSSRANVGAPFSGPTPVPGDVNTDNSEAGPVLSGDEMTMIFGRATDRWNMYMARRSAPGGPFSVLRELTELNDPVCATYPGFVSSDLTWMWFSSTRPDCPGPHDIFVAEMLLETPTPSPTATQPPLVGPLWIFR